MVLILGPQFLKASVNDLNIIFIEKQKNQKTKQISKRFEHWLIAQYIYYLTLLLNQYSAYKMYMHRYYLHISHPGSKISF